MTMQTIPLTIVGGYLQHGNIPDHWDPKEYIGTDYHSFNMAMGVMGFIEDQDIIRYEEEYKKREQEKG